MFSFMKSATFLAALTLVPSVFASPSRELPTRHRRASAVPVPDVLYPKTSGTAVWVIGFQHNVTWDATGVSGTDGSIFLAKGGVEDPSPLASSFDLSTGRVEVTVPSVTPATDYTILLTINGTSSSSTPFTIAESKSDVPPTATVATSGVTTVVFPSTTITATVGASSASGASSSDPSSVSGLSSALSSVASSFSSALSSVASGTSSAASSIHASSTAPSSASASSSSSSSPSSNAAGRVEFEFAAMKLVVAAAAIAVTAGASML